jgi:hypothetical protein
MPDENSSDAIDSTKTDRPNKRRTVRKRRRSTKAEAKPNGKADKVRHVARISGEQLPRKSLEQALRVARALRDVLAGGPATWDEIASAMGISAGTQMNKYFLWAAQAYGLVEKEGDRFSLAENARKILAPTRPDEDKEAAVRAVLTPVVFSRFFTDYNGNPFPSEEHIGNVLERRYGVPRDRVEQAKTLLTENGMFAGILRQDPNGAMVVRLDPSTTGIPSAPEALSPEPPPNSDLQPIADAGEFARMCFVITPIGDDDSAERKHANMILRSVIEPVVGELGLSAKRADQIDRAGLITQQIFQCLAKARVCIADLSFNNPNAFYELGIRHMCKLPTVQIIRKGDRIPFDVSQGRTIKIDMTDVYTVLDSVESAKKELRQHLKHALSSDYRGEDNPVNTYLPGTEVKVPR